MWPIPFSYSDAQGSHNLLIQKSKQIILSEGFIKSNTGETGVYRSFYDKAILHNLIENISSGNVKAIDRLGAIRDIHAGMLNCSINTKDVFKLLEAYKTEKEYIVWTEIVGILSHIRFIYQGEVWMKSFEKYINDFLEPIYKNIGWKKIVGEAHTDSLLRSLILATLVSTGNSEVIAKAIVLYNKKHIDPDLRNAVYSAVIKNKNKKLLDSILKKYIHAHMHEEKNRLARSRIGTSSVADFTKTLKWILTSEVRNQDAPMYLAQALYNRYNKDKALIFVFAKWSFLLKKHAGDKRTFGRLIGAMDGFNTKEDLQKIKQFFKENPFPGAERTFKQTIEQISANIYFRKYHDQELSNIFKK